ncbi:MAG: hypothetical protein VW518_01210 [Burkholderiaceae bacterium]
MTLWDEITRNLYKEIEDLKKVLAYGGVSDYPSYRQIVGKVEGMEYAIDCLQHVVKTRIEEDDSN